MAGLSSGHFNSYVAAISAPAAKPSGEADADAIAPGVSIAVTLFFTAFCTFSKARTSIWRTRSRETPNSSASCSSVTGSSARRRASKMRRSRSLRHGERGFQRGAAIVEFLAFGHHLFLADAVVRQPVLPFAAVAVVADRRVERRVAAEAAVHVDNVLLRHAKALGDDLDLIGAQIALLQRRDFALGLAQVEEQLLLVRGGAHFHERPRTQDVFLDRRLDPPHGIGGEAEALLGLEALDGLHQADIAFRHDFGNRQAIAAVTHRDLGDEPQMAGDEFMRGVPIAVFAPALGQHVFFLRFQHREPADFFQVTGQTAFGGHHRQSRGTGHNGTLLTFLVPPIIGGLQGPSPLTKLDGAFRGREIATAGAA